MTSWIYVGDLPELERSIIAMQVERLRMGLAQYGPWRLDDGRDLGRETIAEIVDGLSYLCAELLRYDQDRSPNQDR